MCGIAGIIAQTKTEFNVNHFNVLGTLNDERGGDSCGIFIDNYIKYGIHQTKLFRNFTETVQYPEMFQIALLHCRKASAGYIVNVEQAQPVIITENEQTKFVLMHNGTITNISTLANKYIPNVNIQGQSDSQILAQIIYTTGYKVLQEYRGSAVLVMVDYRTPQPTILFFKGSSCYNEAGAKSERPLYYMYNDNSFYFSSMRCSLYNINYKKIIYDFPVNKLLQLKENKLVVVKEIDRTKLTLEVFKTNVINYDYDYGYANYINFDLQDNVYVINDQLAHGKVNVYPGGYITTISAKDNNYVHELVFFKGRLLYNQECFDFLNNLTDLFDDQFLEANCPEVIDYFSYVPLIDQSNIFIVNENLSYQRILNHTFVILFQDSCRISVKDGTFSKVSIYPTEAMRQFKETAKTMHFNFDSLEEDMLKLISSKIVNTDDI